MRAVFAEDRRGIVAVGPFALLVFVQEDRVEVVAVDDGYREISAPGVFAFTATDTTARSWCLFEDDVAEVGVTTFAGVASGSEHDAN